LQANNFLAIDVKHQSSSAVDFGYALKSVNEKASIIYHVKRSGHEIIVCHYSLQVVNIKNSLREYITKPHQRCFINEVQVILFIKVVSLNNSNGRPCLLVKDRDCNCIHKFIQL